MRKTSLALLVLATIFYGCASPEAGQSASADKPRALFDGKSITGWKPAGGFATYKVEDGAIVGTTAEGSPNTFLVPPGTYDDFELTFDVKVDDALNSGVQIRSHILQADKAMGPKNQTRKAGTVYGYQVEIATNGTAGNVWDEARHTKWHDPEVSDAAKAAFKNGQWNHYRVVAQGDHIRTWVNGVLVADFRDSEDRSGILGFQVHGIKKGTGPYQVRWKNIQIRKLPVTPEIK